MEIAVGEAVVDVVVVLVVAVAVGRAGWAATLPPGRVVLASAPVAGTGNHT